MTNEKGITLIALIITIIVLLILAGVSINAVVGDNGVLTQAQNASKKTSDAKIEEQRQFTIAAAAMNFENTEYEDKNGDKAIIPAGFAVSEVEGENIIEDGLVIIDNNGNEFVWIPVKDADSYKKREGNYINGHNSVDDTNYLPDGIIVDGETDLEKEKNLITRNKIQGFYISRYEAGDGSATANRTKDSDMSGALVSKKGAYVYNFISQEDAKTKSKSFVNNSNVKSGLCTGIQWDMTMEFVDGKNDGTGEIFDVSSRGSSSRRIGILSRSGQNETDKVCNIYDLEGNCYEYVAERNDSSDKVCVQCGGCYNYIGWATNYHIPTWKSDKWDGLAFRFVLYII